MERERSFSAMVFTRYLIVIDTTDNDGSDLFTSARMQTVLQSAFAVRVYHTIAIDVDASESYIADKSCRQADRRLGISLLNDTHRGLCFTAVPVCSIHDREGKAAVIAFDVFGQ